MQAVQTGTWFSITVGAIGGRGTVIHQRERRFEGDEATSSTASYLHDASSIMLAIKHTVLPIRALKIREVIHVLPPNHLKCKVQN